MRLPLYGVIGVKDDVAIFLAVTGNALCLGVMTLLKAFFIDAKFDYALFAVAAVC